MKRLFTFILLAVLTGTLCTYAQSELIINENFQDWEATEDTDPADCEAGHEYEIDIVRQMTLTIEGGTTDLDVKLMKASIMPECDTKRVEKDPTRESTEGVTVGYVALTKVEADTDTIGEFVFGPVAQIDSMRFGHSATGGERGIRIYKSTDGETWERATDEEFNDGGDSQAGDLNSVVIDETDVYIKFTSGIKVDESSQVSRLHNLEVWGVPGAAVVGLADEQTTEQIKIIPLGEGLFRVSGDYTALSVYNISGAAVYSKSGSNSSAIDLSALPDGIYIVQVLDQSGQVFVRKLLKD